jgi:TRAP-type mannitol/chloroaromatic compound transport system permease small subunit
MGLLNKFSTIIDAGTQRLGQVTAWLAVAMALLMVFVVVLRYAFGIGAIAAQESVSYMHSALFMLGASYTLLADEHVRVDIFYSHFSPRGKAWVNVLGHIVFTLPLVLLIGFSSLDYVSESWRSLEGSPEPGGIHGVYLLKTLIPLMAALLALQAISIIIKGLLVLSSSREEPLHGSC